MAEGRSHTRLLAPTAGVLAIGAFCGLVVWGLAWGVPGDKRSELEGTTEAAKNLDAELLRRSWQTWGSRGRRSPLAESFPRHLFNPLRSYHPDEYQVFKSLATMSPGRLDFDPKNYIYWARRWAFAISWGWCTWNETWPTTSTTRTRWGACIWLAGPFRFWQRWGHWL